MTEHISIRRFLRAGVVVNVTQVEGTRKVHWAERVLDPNQSRVASTIRLCRAKCVVLWTGIEEAEHE